MKTRTELSRPHPCRPDQERHNFEGKYPARASFQNHHVDVTRHRAWRNSGCSPCSHSIFVFPEGDSCLIAYFHSLSQFPIRAKFRREDGACVGRGGAPSLGRPPAPVRRFCRARVPPAALTGRGTPPCPKLSPRPVPRVVYHSGLGEPPSVAAEGRAPLCCHARPRGAFGRGGRRCDPHGTAGDLSFALFSTRQDPWRQEARVWCGVCHVLSGSRPLHFDRASRGSAAGHICVPGRRGRTCPCPVFVPLLRGGGMTAAGGTRSPWQAEVTRPLEAVVPSRGMSPSQAELGFCRGRSEWPTGRPRLAGPSSILSRFALSLSGQSPGWAGPAFGGIFSRVLAHA